MGSKKRTMSRRTGRKGPKKSYRSSSKRVPVGMRSFNATSSRYEKKYFDTEVTLASNATTAAFVPTLNGIAQNTDPFGRVGKQITVTNVNCHLKLTSGQAPATTAAGQYRVILGIDKQSNGAAPLITDILSSAPLATISPNSFRNMFTLDRFVILKDKLVTLNRWSTNGTGAYEGSKVFKLSWKGAVPVMYKDTGATVSSVTSNNFFLLMLANTTAGGGASEQLVGVARIKYTDM